MTGEQRKFELSVPQIVGSALAAVTAAVAASYLGVAGTVIGAAVVSIASTVATAVYTHYLKRTGDRVKQHTLSAWREQQDREDAEQGLLAAAAHATPPADDGDGPFGEREHDRLPGDGERGRLPGEGERGGSPGEGGRGRPSGEGKRGRPSGEGGAGDTLVMAVVGPGGRRGLPWGRVAVAAALVFGVSMGGILAYQAVAQETLHEQVTGKSPARKQPVHAPVKDRDQGRDEDRTPTDRPVTPTPTDTPRTPPPSATPEPSVTPTPEESVEPSPETTATQGEEDGQQRPDPGDEQQPQPSTEPPATEEQPDAATPDAP